MKANELMIGDWVLALASHGEEFSPTKVRNIYDADEDEPCGTIKETYGRIIGSYEFKPIPLTPEILKANEHKRVGVSKFGFPNIVIDTPKCYILKDFSHVHELQHALRLCGLNELADNFKVSPN